MRKQVIAIIAVVAAIVVIGAVLIGTGSKNNKEDQKVIDELGATVGVEDSIFEDTEIESDHEKGSADIPGNKNNDQSKNDNQSKDDTSTGNNKDNGGTSDNNKPAKPADGADKDNGKMDYESFHAMSPSDQQAYMESFGSVEKFFAWYNKAKAKYEKDNPAIEIDGGTVDLGDL